MIIIIIENMLMPLGDALQMRLIDEERSIGPRNNQIIREAGLRVLGFGFFLGVSRVLWSIE